MSGPARAPILPRVNPADLSLVHRSRVAEQAANAARVVTLMLRDPARVTELLYLASRTPGLSPGVSRHARAFVLTYGELERRCRAWPGEITTPDAAGAFAAAWRNEKGGVR